MEKIPPYEEICEKAGVTDAQVAYMGDDLTDIPLIRRVGLGVAVANGRKEVLEAADSFGASAGQRLWGVQLPLALPNIMAGILGRRAPRAQGVISRAEMFC